MSVLITGSMLNKRHVVFYRVRKDVLLSGGGRRELVDLKEMARRNLILSV